MPTPRPNPTRITAKAMGTDPGRYLGDHTDGPGTDDDLMSTVVMTGRADLAGRLAVVANAIGYEMLRHDGRPRRLIDGVDGIDVTHQEAQRCRATAARVLDHLATYDAGQPAVTLGPWVVQWDTPRAGTVYVLGPGYPAPMIEILNGESLDARLALAHDVARHLNGATR